MIDYFEDKKRLLEELKVGTLNQLAAVQAGDPERFLNSTEMCNPIIERINILDLQGFSISEAVKSELRGLLLDIAEIREQISTLIPALHEKLKQKSLAEKQLNVAKRRYKQDDTFIPSIFLDKKI